MMSGSLRDQVFEAKLGFVRRAELEELRALMRNERLEPAALRSLQQARAADLARFAMTHTDYYRERYARAGIEARDLADPEAFQSLPVLERADVRENLERIRSSEATPSNSQPAATGGSTGEPLRVFRDARSPHRTLGLRLHRWWGVGPGDNKALIWRDASCSFWGNLRRNLLWWPTRTVQMDANRIDEKSTAHFVDAWERVRPALLTGYVGAVIELAQFLVRSGRKIPPPKAIGLTAAPVTPGQKRFLGEVFDAPVYDNYQCIEVPMIAGECSRSNGLHVFADARLIELIDRDGRPVGPGEAGEVVITDFRNRVFPLIRYRLGDLARWKREPCSCGVTFPMLEPVCGRISDALRFPSGLVIAGEGLNSLFHPWPEAVRQVQLRQEADYSLTLRCVRGIDPNADAIMRRVAERLSTMVRGEVPVRLEVVESIQHDRGKPRTIVSAVDPSGKPPNDA
jgi:phenylacetate-CoA ligase